MDIIKTTNLTKYYKNIRGIEDITLTVNEGEIFGFNYSSQILQSGTGVCTDYSILYASLCRASGIPANIAEKSPSTNANEPICRSIFMAFPLMWVHCKKAKPRFVNEKRGCLFIHTIFRPPNCQEEIYG